MNDFNSSNNSDNGNSFNCMMDHALAKGKGLGYIGGGNTADAARARLQNAAQIRSNPVPTVSDTDLRPVHQQIGGTQTSVQVNSGVPYAADPVFTTEAGFPVTDASKINAKTIVQCGRHKMSVGCAQQMGLLKQNGPGSYEFTEEAYEGMASELERKGVPGQVVSVDFQANSDKELYNALDYKLGGKLDSILMQAVTNFSHGKDPFSADLGQLISQKMPEVNPVKAQEAITNYIQQGVDAACSFAGSQAGGLSGEQVKAIIETKSDNCRATFMRAVVSGQPREVLAVWTAIRNGSLK